MNKIYSISLLVIRGVILFCMIFSTAFAANKTVILPLDGQMYVIPASEGVVPPPPVPTVVSAGQIWMDRNLGAIRVATGSTDKEAYGDLYQWGRLSDGHENRSSLTTSDKSTTDTPGHGSFIFTSNDYPWDWRSPQSDNLWQGVSGTNNPCPAGFRLPTDTELATERTSWNSNNSAGAFASPLRLISAGHRSSVSGTVFDEGNLGFYWSSTVIAMLSLSLQFQSDSSEVINQRRASGFSIRCLKD